MESCISHPQRIVWTHHHVLRPHELPHHIPVVHEWLLPQYDCQRMACHLHGWPHLLLQYHPPQEMHQKSTTMHDQVWSSSKAWEMQVCHRQSGISRNDCQTWTISYGSYQTQWNHMLAYPNKSQGCMLLPWLHQFLPTICPQFLKYHSSPHWPY